MTQDDDEEPGNRDKQEPEYDANPFDRTKRQQPVFSAFEEDESLPYEEPDRDTDYASGFREDSLEDDEFDDYLPEEDDREGDEPPVLGEPAGFEPEPTSTLQQPRITATESNQTWLEEEYPVEDVPGSAQPWPLGLIAVGALALVLLIAGGYGVIQQRSETQEEILQLQAALATAASPEDVNASRAAVRELKRENARLASQSDAYGTENRRLIDTVAELEAQLEAQRAAKGKVKSKPQLAPAPAKPKPVQPKASAPVAAKPVTPKPAAPKPRPEATRPAPVAAQTATNPAGGTWFVNFSSYGQRATAETWKTRLQPGSGKVIIAPSVKDGKTFYRVRVIDLTSRESADKVARSLEKEYGLPKLWIGKQ
jgi:cell division septation protein DedD